MAARLRAAAGGILAPVLAAAALLAALAAAPVVLAGDPCFHGYSIPPASTAASTSVDMEPCAFVPTNVTVATGATVTFTNTSGDVHLLTGANQAWGHREAQILPGRSVAVTFEKPGIYAFSCALHSGMSGAVIVGDAVDAAGGSASIAGAAGGVDGGLAVPLALAALAVLAIIGWVTALRQRRRLTAA
jgi:plastocyanin